MGAAKAPWRFAMLLAAPHRLAFFAGASMLAASAFWWLAVLVARFAAGDPVPWALAPVHAHALLMGLSFMPMFFAGFVCTAAPRWLALPAVGARELQPIVAGWLAGWGVFVVGAHLSIAVAALGLAVVAAAWSVFCVRFFRMLGASRKGDRSHLRVIAAACAVGAALAWIASAAIAVGESAAIQYVVAPMLWWFLAPVFAAALHRMIPFFGTVAPALDERHPNWLLHAWVLLFAVQPLAAWPFAHHGAAAIAGMVADAIAGALLLWLSARWFTTYRPSSRLLQMLFVGFAWLGVAVVLQSAKFASAATAMASGLASLDLHRASVHALAMGFFGSTMLAMVSRITCGQERRMLSAERPVWMLFLGLQAATAIRVASSLLPGSSVPLLAAASFWALAMGAWAVRYIGWYGRPRADGRPG